MLTLFRTDIYSLIMPTPESVLSSISHNAPSPTSMDTIDYNTHMTTMPICTHDHCHITVTQIQVAHAWTPPGHLHTHIIIFTWTFTSWSTHSALCIYLMYQACSCLLFLNFDPSLLSCFWIFAFILYTLFAHRLTHNLIFFLDLCLVIWICLLLLVVLKHSAIVTVSAVWQICGICCWFVQSLLGVVIEQLVNINTCYLISLS